MIWGTKGFTLFELLAVLVILGIILAIAVPRLDTVIAGSKSKVCAENVEMLNHAVEIYYEVENVYPHDQQILLEAGYLDKLVKCPVDQEQYEFNNNKFSCNGH